MRSTTAWLTCGLVLAGAGCTTGDTMRAFDANFEFDGSFDAGTTSDAGPDAAVESCTEESMGSTIGESCTAPADCDDGCFCNGVETCREGVCVEGIVPCQDDDGIECTEYVCDEGRNQCVTETHDEMCQDDDMCNGAEVCDPSSGCRSGEPLFCNDEDSCTIDSCDPDEGCVFEPRDLDGDGYVDAKCGGDDCDDDPRTGRNVHPDAEEVCDNGRDDDCDGLRDFHDPDCEPDNDTCGEAQVLDGEGTYSGSTRALSDDYDLDCTDGGPDAVFRFTIEETQDVQATVSGASGVSVALRAADDCDSGPDIRCASGSPAIALQRSLEAGEYVLIVESSSATAFDLTLRFSEATEPPPVDVCNAETEDVSEGGSFSGMYIDVQDDYDVDCYSGDAKDAAYQFTIDEPKDVTITASSSGGSFTSTYIALVTDCNDADSVLQCRSGSTASLQQRELPAGTYYILLEPTSSSASTWDMTVDIREPEPREPGDACSTAIDITEGEGSASLSDAEFDSGTSCGSSSFLRRDVFFTFTLDETRDVQLTTDANGASHRVALQEECGVAGSELRCRSVSSPHTQNWRSLEAGTYYVAVETSRSYGEATASVTTSEPTPQPENDTCDGAIDVSGGYSSSDSLLGFEDDVDACGSGRQPDAFYVLNLPSEKIVAASAARETTGDVSLTLRADECDAADEVACASGDEEEDATILRTLDAGTYYLIVEQPSGELGDFDLTVLVTDP